MKKANLFLALGCTTSALVITGGAIGAAVVYQSGKTNQPLYLDPQGSTSANGLVVSSYFNLVEALGFDTNVNLKTFDNEMIAAKLANFGFSDQQLKVSIKSADSQKDVVELAINLNGQDLDPIRLSGFNWNYSLDSSRTIANFNSQINMGMTIISFDEIKWWNDNYPLRLGSTWNANQVNFLTKLSSDQIKDHIKDIQIKLDQPLFGKEVITYQDNWWSYLKLQFVKNTNDQVDLDLRLDHPDWHQSQLKWQNNKWIDQTTDHLENRLQWNQTNDAWGFNWSESLAVGVSPEQRTKFEFSDQNNPIIVNEQVQFGITRWDLEKALITNNQNLLKALSQKLIKSAKDLQALKQIFGFDELISNFIIKSWNDGFTIEWVVNDHSVGGFERQLPSNWNPFKTYEDQLKQLELTLTFKHLEPVAIAFIKQVKSDQKLLNLINNWINKDQDFTYQFEFKNFDAIIKQIIGSNFINNPYTLAKTKQNFAISSNYGKWLDNKDIDFDNKWWNVIDLNDQSAVTLGLDWAWNPPDYPILIDVKVENKKLVFVKNTSNQNVMQFLGNSISTKLNFNLTKQEWRAYENIV